MWELFSTTGFDFFERRESRRGSSMEECSRIIHICHVSQALSLGEAIDSWLVGSTDLHLGCRESRRCSRDTSQSHMSPSILVYEDNGLSFKKVFPLRWVTVKTLVSVSVMGLVLITRHPTLYTLNPTPYTLHPTAECPHHFG